MGLVGFDIAGSSGDTTTCVTTVATGVVSPASASSACSDCWSRYPISPCVVASQTSSGCV